MGINLAMIFYILGWVVRIESILMIPSLITAIVYQETAGFAILITQILCLLLSFILARKRPENQVIYAKEGFVTVALSWIILSLMGCLPFIFSGAISSPIDALFETVSGFTTTGASILSDIPSLPHCILFWRSFTHWIGGMGVLVFLLSILPLTGAGGYQMNLMKAESPGPSVEKMVPKVRQTASMLYRIYAFLTLSLIFLLIVGGMPVFDALTLSFGTAGTGGFGVLNDSIASYSTYSQVVITIFMMLFGVNFSIYYLIITKKFKRALQSEELHWYVAILVSAIVIISLLIRNQYNSVGETVLTASFQVGSLMTTTGYATADFNLWPETARTILVILMFIGACGGSTGGGMKVSRIILLFKSASRELHLFLHPNSVKGVMLDKKAVDGQTLRTFNAYIAAYLLIFVISLILISFNGYDGVTNFTAVAATINNIGPGLNLIGPTENYAIFSTGSKLVLIFDMLAGRLELFPMLMLLYPPSWRKF